MTKSIKHVVGMLGVFMLLILAACGGSSSSGGSSDGGSSSSGDSSGGSGSSEPSLTFKVATTSGEGGAIYEGAMKFKELVEERSEGDIIVEVFPDGQLGKDLSVMDAHKTGTIEMSLPSTATAQKIPEFGAFDIPFLFANREKVEQIANGPIWNEELKPKFADHGMVGLGFWENGFRHITNNIRPINTPEDLEGIKLRVPESKLRVAAFKEFGANPVTMDFSEVFTALQQGVVDGQENPVTQIEAGRFYEVQKYLSVTSHTYTPAYLVASKMWWDKLTPEQQELLEVAAVDAGDYSREYGAGAEGELLKKFEEAGVEINEADIPSFQAKIQPVIEALKEEIDPDFIDRLVEAAK